MCGVVRKEGEPPSQSDQQDQAGDQWGRQMTQSDRPHPQNALRTGFAIN